MGGGLKEKEVIVEKQFVWVKADGTEIPVSKLSNEHAFNIVKMLARRFCKKILTMSGNHEFSDLQYYQPNPFRFQNDKGFPNSKNSNFVYYVYFSKGSRFSLFNANESAMIKTRLIDAFKNHMFQDYLPFHNIVGDLFVQIYMQTYLYEYLKFLVIQKGLKFSV